MNDDEINDDENDIEVKNIDNYKGYFIENGEQTSNFYEFGAHFPYKELCKILNILKQAKEDEDKKIEKIVQVNKIKISHKERNNTRNKKKENNNNIIQKIFKSNKRSRNFRALDSRIGNQNELTFIPKKYFMNIFSTKKDDKNMKNKITTSFKKNLGQKNYIRINNNVTDIISINSTSNKKIYKNDKNKNAKIHFVKYPKIIKKYILTRNQNKNNLNQQIKLSSKNKPLNQENSNNSFDVYLYKTFQTQMEESNNKSVKNIKSNNFSSSANSKDKLNKKIKSNKDFNEKKNYSKLNYNSYKKILLSLKKGKNKNIKIDKIINKSLNSFKSKNSLANLNRKLVSTPLDSVLKQRKKLKKNRLLADVKKNICSTLPPNLNIYKTSYNSSYKLNNKNGKNIKNNHSLKKHLYIPILFINNSNHFNINESNDTISVSFYTNKKYMLNSKTIDKFELNKDNKNKNIAQSSFNQFYNNNRFNINFLSQCSNLSTDCLNKSNKNALYKKIESNIKKFNIYNCNNRIKDNSRNKFNHLLINNLSSLNITNNKNKKNENNIDFFNINRTQQNTDFFTIKNKNITHNKTLNNLNSNKNNNKKHKKIIIPCSSSKKENFVSSLNNNNSSCYLNKIKNNCYNIDKLFINKSKKKRLNLDLLKGLLVKKQNKHLKNKTINLCNDTSIKNNTFNNNNKKNNFSTSNINGLSGSKKIIKANTKFEEKISPRNKIDLKTCQNLTKKTENRNNNIIININNNNNIIYNKIKNYKNNSKNNESSNTINNLNKEKSPFKIEKEKIVKTPSFNGNKLLQNNFKFSNVYFKIKDNKKNKASFGNNHLQNDKQVRHINIQFPKVKFININNINNK